MNGLTLEQLFLKKVKQKEGNTCLGQDFHWLVSFHDPFQTSESA